MTVFKVGDKARIRKDLKDGNMYDTCNGGCCYCNASMAANYSGNIVVVESKDPNSGFMTLRLVDSGATYSMPWKWSDDMLEPLEETETKHNWPLNVGETIKIRNDIAERVGGSNRIWVTLNGKKYNSYLVSDRVRTNGGKEIVITKVYKDIGHIGNIRYKARLKDEVTEIDCDLDITMFDCFHDWFAEKKQMGKKDAKSESEKPKPRFKIGDKVVRKPSVNEMDEIDGLTIYTGMYEQTEDKYSGKLVIGEITYICDYDKKPMYYVAFGNGTIYTWPEAALEYFSGNAEKKKKIEKGDKVIIKTSVSAGEKVDGVTISNTMYRQAYKYEKGKPLRRAIGVVISTDGAGLAHVTFDPTQISYIWPIGAFQLYQKNKENKKYEDTKTTQQHDEEQRKNLESKADCSGYTPKSEFYCYDYLNRKATFCRGAMENITKIEITVMSGDETGCFYGVTDGKPWQYRFDTMTTSRFQSYDDGSYTVEGRENIEKWINWSYEPEKAIYAEYSMERMRAFKR